MSKLLHHIFPIIILLGISNISAQSNDYLLEQSDLLKRKGKREKSFQIIEKLIQESEDQSNDLLHAKTLLAKADWFEYYAHYDTALILAQKTIEFAEDEILKENATYQINFGNAVKDFSVGNIFENYVFVFSTGPVIDSLSVSGKVIDELTGEPVKDVLVMLYENLADSALILDKPFYFSKTTDDGSFQLNNLRADTFQLFGLKDENVSYTYDLPEERVAFYNKHIIIINRLYRRNK